TPSSLTTGPTTTALSTPRLGRLDRHSGVVSAAQILGALLALGRRENALRIRLLQEAIVSRLPSFRSGSSAIGAATPAFVGGDAGARRRPRCHQDTPLPRCLDGSSETTFARIAQPLRYVVAVSVALRQAMSSTTGRRPSSASRIAA